MSSRAACRALALALLVAASSPTRARDGAGADALLERAEQHLDAGQVDAALGLLHEALRADPSHWRSLCRLGDIHMALKRYEEAERALTAAVAIQPASGLCLSRLGQLMLLKDRLAEAEAALTRAAGLLPADEAIQFNLGRLYELTDRPELAIRAYDRHLTLTRDAKRAALTHLRMARLLMAGERAADATGHLTAYLAEFPDRHDVRAELASALAGASRFKEALAEYDRLIGSGAAGAAHLAKAASIHLLFQDVGRAVELLERAVGAEPTLVEARVALGSAQARSGDHARAVETLRTATLQDPQNVQAFFLLGQSLMKLGREEEAREALARHRSIHESLMPGKMTGGR